MKGLIFIKTNVTQATANALQEMVDNSFVMTALIDRMQSVLDVAFAYNNTSRLIHHGLAHRYSGYFGDAIADLGLQGYDISVNYGNVPLMSQQYESVEQLLITLREKVFDYQNALNMCYKIAFDNMDLHICADLTEIIVDHNKVVRQMILLCNKIAVYKDNPSFDAHIENHFWNLGD